MSTGTNQERIEQNNVKLSALKVTVDNLPEYQDVEPIYAATNYRLCATNSSRTIFNYIGDYFINYQNYRFYLNKINSDGTITNILNKPCGNQYSSAYPAILDIIDSKLYYMFIAGSYPATIDIYEVDLLTNTEIQYDSVSTGISGYSANLVFIRPGISQIATSGYTFYYDIPNKTKKVTRMNYSGGDCNRAFTANIIGANSGSTSGKSGLIKIDDEMNILYKYGIWDSINFVNQSGSKIVINNSMYNFSDDMVLGAKIKDNVFDNFDPRLVTTHLFGNYYGITYFNTGSSNYYTIETFDEDTNTFTEVFRYSNFSGNSSTCPYFTDPTSNQYKIYYTGENYTNLIGYKVQGQNIYLHNNYGNSTDKITPDIIVYDYYGNKINGTMTNNGTLTYTPTTSQQTIPQGYTDGGTIAAVTAAIDANITQNNIKAGVTILGVQGNLEPDKPDQTKTATPTTSQQVIEPDTGYELVSVTVNAVTSSIDQNITAGNIKKDVTILGVTGTYEGSGSASPNIFVQTTEPTGKQGIWLQIADKAYTTVVAEDTIGGNPTWLPDGTVRAIPYDFRLGMTAVIGTDIYVLSGNDEPTYAYKYNTLANTYTQLTDIPYEATNGSATAVGTDIYIFGGNDGTTTAYKYSTSNDTYTQLTAIPYDFYGGAAVAVGTDIYLFGGESESQYAYKYNTSNGTYTQLTGIPYEFIYGSAVAVGTDIYLFGGSEDEQKAYKYNTLNDSYARLTDISYEFVNGSIAVKGTDIYLFGGIKDAQKTYKYDTLGGTYTQMTNIPYSFQYGSAAAVGSNIYLFGDFTNTTKVQVLSFPAASFSNNSVVILNGSTYKTQLFTSQLVDTSVKYSFADVWFYTTQEGLIATTPTYYGDGTQWINIKNPPPEPEIQDHYEIEYD